MSKRDKLRRKLKNNPKSATLQDITTLLGYFGFVLVRIVGSHHVFRYDSGDTHRNIVIPVHDGNVRGRYI
jgi:predicted RNA binding protein YcfA (HicA-like mRNA interferase family)